MTCKIPKTNLYSEKASFPSNKYIHLAYDDKNDIFKNTKYFDNPTRDNLLNVEVVKNSSQYYVLLIIRKSVELM